MPEQDIEAIAAATGVSRRHLVGTGSEAEDDLERVTDELAELRARLKQVEDQLGEDRSPS